MASRAEARVIKSDFYEQCPVCHFSERHLVSCVVSKLEAQLERAEVAITLEVGLMISMSWSAWKGCRNHAQFEEIVRQRDLAFNTLYNVLHPARGCVCDGPVPQPCSLECRYPYTDQRGGPYYARPGEVPFQGKR